MLAALIDFMPLLSLFGALALVLVAAAVIFWPWVESPLITFLEGVRDWRAHRLKRRNMRKAMERRLP